MVENQPTTDAHKAIARITFARANGLVWSVRRPLSANSLGAADSGLPAGLRGGAEITVGKSFTS